VRPNPNEHLNKIFTLVLLISIGCGQMNKKCRHIANALPLGATGFYDFSQATAILLFNLQFHPYEMDKNNSPITYLLRIYIQHMQKGL